MSEITTPDPFAVLAAYAYDALGRRVRRIDYVTGGTTATTVKYYYDGQNVVAEFDGSTTPVLQRYYIHGATYIDERAVMRDAVGGQDFYYFLRELYTVDGLVNNRGHEVERYLYDAYGKASIVTVNIHDIDYNGVVNAADRGFVMTGTAACDDPITDLDANGVINAADKGFITANYGPGLVAGKVSGIRNPYLFTGRDLDTYYNGPTDEGDNVDFAVQYNRARYYDPENGRWLQRELLRYVDGMNLYEYVKSSSPNWLDPTGLQSVPAGFAEAVAAGWPAAELVAVFGVSIEAAKAALAAAAITAAIKSITDAATEVLRQTPNDPCCPCAKEHWPGITKTWIVLSAPGPHWRTTAFSSTIDAGIDHQFRGTAAHLALLNADLKAMGLGAVVAANHYQKALDYCRSLKRQIKNLRRCLTKNCYASAVATQYLPIKALVGITELKCDILMKGGPPGP